MIQFDLFFQAVENAMNYNVFSVENGKYYKLPMIENEIKPQKMSENGNNILFDNSFWNN